MVDVSKLSFTSAFRYEQVYLKGDIPFSVTASSGFGSFPIVHNLGYIPFARLWYGFGDGRIFECFAGPESYNIAGNNAQVDNISSDINQIIVSIDNFNGSGGATITGTIYYRIYKEQLI